MRENLYIAKADFTAVILKHTVTVTVADMKAKTFKDETMTVYTGQVADLEKVIEKAISKEVKNGTVTDIKTEKVLAVQTFEQFMTHATFKAVPESRLK